MGWFDQLTKPKAPLAPQVSLPPNFVLPEPKPLTVTRLDTLPDLLKSGLAFGLRLGTGAFVLGWKIDTLQAPTDDGRYALSLGPLRLRDSSSVLAQAPRPAQNLILYEYQASPYCQRVREMINLLDLVVDIRPCPGARQGAFSEELFQLTGRRTVPFLIDPNTGIEMFESSAIIEYLLEQYGPPAGTYDRKALWPITWEPFSVATTTQVALLRGLAGSRLQTNARPDNSRMRPLQVWGYESSPFVRPVLEKLCSLGLPHTRVSCARGSIHRDELIQRTGKAFQVPFLVDPNTGMEMFESAAIVDYLEQVYTV
jgi:glutathione S-transferase